MSDDDTASNSEDPEKSKVRDNVSPELKPKNETSSGKAPRGSMGMAPTPGGSGLDFTPQYVSSSVPQPESAQQKEADPKLDYHDNRPLAVRTGDKEVDDEAAKKNRLVDQHEFDRLTQPPSEPDNTNSRFENDSYRPLTAKTGDKEVDADAATHNHVVDQQELKRLQKEALIKRLQQDRNNDLSRDR